MATAAKAVAADSTKGIAPTPAAQQSDNVAHALAGAGGGILSTALTYVLFQCISWRPSHLTKDIL